MRRSAPVADELADAALELVGLRAGQRLLDVAAGRDGLSLPAARRGATVVWPATSERFQTRAPREQGLDQHRLGFDDDTFDVTASRSGVMRVPDQPQALREMVRVTKTGGRVLVITYASPTKVEVLQFFVGALQAVVLDFEGLAESPPPLDLQAADPAVLGRRLEDAGLRDVTVDIAHVERLKFASGRQVWDWCLGDPIASMLVADLTDDQRGTIRDVLDGMLRERSNGNGPGVLTNAVNIGIGTK